MKGRLGAGYQRRPVLGFVSVCYATRLAASAAYVPFLSARSLPTLAVPDDLAKWHTAKDYVDLRRLTLMIHLRAAGFAPRFSELIRTLLEVLFYLQLDAATAVSVCLAAFGGARCSFGGHRTNLPCLSRNRSEGQILG